MKTSNSKAREFVERQQSFKGNNTFGEHTAKFYVVYSYGYHFPMYVFDKVNNEWYRNSDKYSVTTSKHMNQLHPHTYDIVSKTTKELKDLIS